MDDINSEDIGYKIGLSGFNLKNGSIPLLIGFNIAQHNQNETKILAYSPEVGLAKKWHYFGSGIAYFSLSYGYSFTEAEFESSINSHYLKFLINTNMKGFIEFLGFTRYKVISIFHPNWS